MSETKAHSHPTYSAIVKRAIKEADDPNGVSLPGLKKFAREKYGDKLGSHWEDHLVKAVHLMHEKKELKTGRGHHTGHYLLAKALHPKKKKAKAKTGKKGEDGEEEAEEAEEEEEVEEEAEEEEGEEEEGVEEVEAAAKGKKGGKKAAAEGGKDPKRVAAAKKAAETRKRKAAEAT